MKSPAEREAERRYAENEIAYSARGMISHEVRDLRGRGGVGRVSLPGATGGSERVPGGRGRSL